MERESLEPRLGEGLAQRPVEPSVITGIVGEVGDPS
jgi:hypothetical protein